MKPQEIRFSCRAQVFRGMQPGRSLASRMEDSITQVGATIDRLCAYGMCLQMILIH